MTTITPINGGTCIRVRMKDEENELDFHIHKRGKKTTLIGSSVSSAGLGTIYSFDLPVSPLGRDCEER